jgi:hypothetical protein
MLCELSKINTLKQTVHLIIHAGNQLDEKLSYDIKGALGEYLSNLKDQNICTLVKLHVVFGPLCKRAKKVLYVFTDEEHKNLMTFRSTIKLSVDILEGSLSLRDRRTSALLSSSARHSMSSLTPIIKYPINRITSLPSKSSFSHYWNLVKSTIDAIEWDKSKIELDLNCDPVILNNTTPFDYLTKLSPSIFINYDITTFQHDIETLKVAVKRSKVDKLQRSKKI